MKNMKERIKETINKKAGELAIKAGGFEGGSIILFINDPKMPKGIIEDRENK